MADGARPLDRRTVVLLHLALCGGYLLVGLVLGGLVLSHQAPLLPDQRDSILPWAMAVFALPSLALGLAWGRPRVPVRPREMPVEAYWARTEAGPRALFCWVLWEGGGMIGLVGTLLTGSVGPAAVAMIALALLVLHTPGYFEAREY